VIPLALTEADEFIRRWHRDHRHHPASKFHKFSLGLLEGDKIIGAIIIGYPMARHTDRHQVTEVNRLAVDGSKDACSQLLARAARACREMGFARFQMFVEPTERTAPSFLRAAGFTLDGETSGAPWDHPSANATRKSEGKDTRTRRSSPRNPKHRWVIDFRPVEGVTPGRRRCNGCGERLPLSSRPERRTCSPACRQLAHRRRKAAAV
jgi:hypothetical protein